MDQGSGIMHSAWLCELKRGWLSPKTPTVIQPAGASTDACCMLGLSLVNTLAQQKSLQFLLYANRTPGSKNHENITKNTRCTAVTTCRAATRSPFLMCPEHNKPPLTTSGQGARTILTHPPWPARGNEGPGRTIRRKQALGLGLSSRDV